MDSIIIYIKKVLSVIVNKRSNSVDNSWIDRLSTYLLKGDKLNYIALCHQDWKGVASSTIELFKHVSYIREVEDSQVDRVVELILAAKIPLIILSGYPNGWSNVIQKVRHKSNCNTEFKVLWHGSIAQHYEEYAGNVFLEILDLNKCEMIRSIGFVKQSTYYTYKNLGFNCEFLRNRVKAITPIKPALDINLSKIKVGIFSVDVTLRKNTYTNIAAVSHINGAHLTICPTNHHLEKMIKHFNLDLEKYNSLPRDKLLKLMCKQDIIFYVTFSECAPMIPLEAMGNGILCLMGSNNHYYHDYPLLQKYLVVTEADNPQLIAEMAISALENKDLIMSEYQNFSKNNEQLSIESVKNFIEK